MPDPYSARDGLEASLPFLSRFLNELILSAGNHFGDENLYNRTPRRSNRLAILHGLSWLFFILAHARDLDETYTLLSDEPSRHLMVQLLLYRVLGYKKVKLVTNTPDFWKRKNLAEGLLVRNAGELQVGGRMLSLFDLSPIGYPIKFRGTKNQVEQTFLADAYQHGLGEPTSGMMQTGDCVIDAGACWGDTALSFALEVGATGIVYCFEFVEQNIEVFNENLRLNPELAERIRIVPRPISDQSDRAVYYMAHGPSTRVATAKQRTADTEVRTISLDDFVISNGIQKVDLIKMDVEGAELDALKGAKATILKHHPKLAICVYHRKRDFIDIPRFISGLGLRYEYVLTHSTIHAYETVLLCH